MGTIFAFKRYAIHDGPNIRTTVFFKGCPLSCWWCHNPEGLDSRIGLIWDEGKCIGCRNCLGQCFAGALSAEVNRICWSAQQCRGCHRCVDNCPALALEPSGREVSVEEVLEVVAQDIPFFDQSGGGVTFSGGEPLAQPQFLLDLLQACGRLGLHRTVDTSGFATWEVVSDVADHTDLFLFDVKLVDRDRHQLYTGVSNRAILDNLRRLVERGCPLQIRFPLIPGINDDPDNVTATGRLITSLGLGRIDLLPFHRGAEAKYRKLDLPNKGAELTPGTPESVARVKALLEGCGLSVRIGG